MTTVILLPFQLWRALCSCMLSGAALPLCPATPPSVNACRIRTMPSSMLAVLERALWSNPLKKEAGWPTVTYSELPYLLQVQINTLFTILFLRYKLSPCFNFGWHGRCLFTGSPGAQALYCRAGSQPSHKMAMRCNETVRNAWNTLKQWWNLWLLTSHAVSCNSSDACENGPALVYLIYTRIDVQEVYIHIDLHRIHCLPASAPEHILHLAQKH